MQNKSSQPDSSLLTDCFTTHLMLLHLGKPECSSPSVYPGKAASMDSLLKGMKKDILSSSSNYEYKVCSLEKTGRAL